MREADTSVSAKSIIDSRISSDHLFYHPSNSEIVMTKNNLSLLLLLPLLLIAESRSVTAADLRERMNALESQLEVLNRQSVSFATLMEFGLGPSADQLIKWYKVDLDNHFPFQFPKFLAIFLGLSEAEHNAMIEIVRHANEQLMVEIAKRNTFMRINDNKYSLIIEPFPIEGRSIEEELMKQAEEVLGSERFGLWHFEKSWFFNFGQDTYTFSFSPHHMPWGDSWLIGFIYGANEIRSARSFSGAELAPEKGLVEGFRFCPEFSFVRSLISEDLREDFQDEFRTWKQLREQQLSRWKHEADGDKFVPPKADDTSDF
jgi:hypothetical protein